MSFGMYSSLCGRHWMALLAETILWALPSSLFLYVYIAHFEASSTVLLPHLIVIAAFWLGIVGLRLVNWRFTAAVSSCLQKGIAAFFLLAPPLLLTLWYTSVLIGLVSWGRITTWPLLKVYLLQLGHLTDVLSLPAWMLLAVLPLFVLLFVLLYRLLPWLDGCRAVSMRLTIPGLLGISLLGMAASVSQVMTLSGLADLHPQEPIGVSFFSSRSSALQSHAVAVSPLVDAAENREWSSYQPILPFSHRNVVLIVGDALRADHMGIYGYSRSTTPFLEASARDYQTLMPRSTRSVCAESSCGLMAIASSRPLHLLPTKPLTLHEVLRRHGYRTNLILGGDHTHFYGLKEAYGAVDSYFDGTHQTARYINDDLLLAEHVAELPPYDGGKPVMFQFHLMSTHGLGLRHDSSEIFQPAVNYYRWPSGKARIAPSPNDIPKAVNYYDNGVLQFDQIVQRLLVELESKGYLDNAVIVITGDHGEMLGEKELFGHQYRVDEEVLRIPLILQRRGYTGEPLGDWSLTSQIDVAPTILRELGIEAPSVWRGVSLQSPVVSRIIHFQQAPQVGLYEVNVSKPPLKYWKNLIAGEEFVYNLQEDPGETSNIVGLFERTEIESWRSEVMSSGVSGQELVHH